MPTLSAGSTRLEINCEHAVLRAFPTVKTRLAASFSGPRKAVTPNSKSAPRRTDDRNYFSSVPPIDAEISFIDCEHGQIVIQFAHANQA